MSLPLPHASSAWPPVALEDGHQLVAGAREAHVLAAPSLASSIIVARRHVPAEIDLLALVLHLRGAARGHRRGLHDAPA